jgi:surface polysaccharide O-acyltransferase-like enzyme
MIEKTIRDSNFEFLRIVLIIMIICLHYIRHGGALKYLNSSNFNFYITYAFESFSIIAVDCFILITGFFQINKKYQFKKIVDLWTQVFFYSILISSIFWIIKLEPITIGNITRTLLPVITIRWWFITAYITLYCLSPFLNAALNSMDQNNHKKLLFALTFFFVILPTFCSSIVFFQDIYFLKNFILLYSIGAYIKKYDIVYKINFIYIYILCCSFTFLISVFIHTINKNNLSSFNYNSIMVELSAICLFMFFKNIKIDSPKINKVAASVFGIYLISDDPFVRKILYSKILHCADYYYSPFFLLHMIISLIGIFIFCLITETFRQQLFRILHPIYNSLIMAISHRLRIYNGLDLSDAEYNLKNKY